MQWCSLPGESAHEAEQRGHALSVLTNNNTLLTYAISRNDVGLSLPLMSGPGNAAD